MVIHDFEDKWGTPMAPWLRIPHPGGISWEPSAIQCGHYEDDQGDRVAWLGTRRSGLDAAKWATLPTTEGGAKLRFLGIYIYVILLYNIIYVYVYICVYIYYVIIIYIYYVYLLYDLLKPVSSLCQACFKPDWIPWCLLFLNAMKTQKSCWRIDLK